MHDLIRGHAIVTARFVSGGGRDHRLSGGRFIVRVDHKAEVSA
jgi:hypothetical protein